MWSIFRAEMNKKLNGWIFVTNLKCEFSWHHVPNFLRRPFELSQSTSRRRHLVAHFLFHYVFFGFIIEFKNKKTRVCSTFNGTERPFIKTFLVGLRCICCISFCAVRLFTKKHALFAVNENVIVMKSPTVGWGHLPSELKASKPCNLYIFVKFQ